jgi:hypothetical protein
VFRDDDKAANALGKWGRVVEARAMNRTGIGNEAGAIEKAAIQANFMLDNAKLISQEIDSNNVIRHH